MPRRLRPAGRLRAVVAIVLAGTVWSYGTYIAPGSGADGPCLGTSPFGEEVQEGSGISSEWSWLPPQERCVEERLDGTRREESYPGPVTFALAGVALILPFAVGRAARALSA
jgi:hypothetical protein